MTDSKTLLDGFGEATEQVVALRAEVKRLQAALRHIREVAEAAALGKESVDHWWYGQQVQRALEGRRDPG